MEHHLFRRGKHRRRRGRYCDYYSYDVNVPAHGPRIPGAILLGGIVIWPFLALGVWTLVDRLLAWTAAMAGPASDLGGGVAGWLGFGKEVSALRDVTDVDRLVRWAGGPLHFLEGRIGSRVVCRFCRVDRALCNPAPQGAVVTIFAQSETAAVYVPVLKRYLSMPSRTLGRTMFETTDDQCSLDRPGSTTITISHHIPGKIP